MQISAVTVQESQQRRPLKSVVHHRLHSETQPTRIFAFTRLELLVAIGVLAVLTGLAGTFAAKTRPLSKVDVCLKNLKQLGVGLAMYEKENNDKLPFAGINYDDHKFATWDNLILPSVRSNLHGKDLDHPVPTTGDVGIMLGCPSDTVPRVSWSVFARRRTYAMTAHSMSSANWPPGPNNATGVGLSWRWRGTANDSLKKLQASTNGTPAVRLAMILEPTATLALTERASEKNLVGHSTSCAIMTTSEHLDSKNLTAEMYHGGKFNYLMIDGHVETLFPQQTVGRTGEAGSDSHKQFGMWTIKAGD